MPPRVWPVFVAFVLSLLLAFGLQVLFVVGLIALQAARGADIKDAAVDIQQQLAHVPIFVGIMLTSQCAFLAGAVVPAWLSPVPFRERLALRSPASWTIYPLTMLGSIPVLALSLTGAEWLARVLTPDPYVGMLFENITFWESIPFVLTVALAPGLCEELLFRGYMQTRLVERWGPWRGLAVASVLFGLAHVMPHAIVAAFPLGVWFGVIAWRTGSILPGMACHAFVNGGLNLWRMIIKFGDVPEAAQDAVSIGSLVVGGPCFVLACRWMFRREREAPSDVSPA